MPSRCCVPFCKTRGGHQFPSTDSSLRDAWIVAIKRQLSKTKKALWKPAQQSVVCREHFRDDDYIKETKFYGRFIN